jgi:Family of unknown function (DUF6118)
MEPDLIAEEMPATDGNDPASKEFRKLKREVGLMRIALERLADEPSKTVIPDYTETLVEMTERVNAVASRMKALREAPALELTPESLAKHIVDAGAVARSAEKATLAAATEKLAATARELLPYVESARTERIQNFWLAAAVALGFAFGLMMGLILPGPIDRAMPEGWHWPERAAANMLDRDMWKAGERLQSTADLRRWKLRSEIEQSTKDSPERVKLCLEAVARKRKPVECRIVFTPIQ